MKAIAAFGMGWVAVALPVLLVAVVVVIARALGKRTAHRH
jgi:hypothetical protein